MFHGTVRAHHQVIQVIGIVHVMKEGGSFHYLPRYSYSPKMVFIGLASTKAPLARVGFNVCSIRETK